ncbi:hypothetical protein [Streptomyces triticiradicis]|uniref:Uncharacterized protein n=1 Tax=Streptomyces triticiradicis TaxID=2651189 RepID=A0A7J5D9D1_9ACTN|nr:hypothetical protein [Streptomyces triticiradicis]KAB1982858.1 hypothetical protein F8144_30140 [Streptomyces triticiradicis]
MINRSSRIFLGAKYLDRHRQTIALATSGPGQRRTPGRPSALGSCPLVSPSTSPVVGRAAQLAKLRRRHCEEVQALRQAIEVAQSENLELRRRLGPWHTARPEPS